MTAERPPVAGNRRSSSPGVVTKLVILNNFPTTYRRQLTNRIRGLASPTYVVKVIYLTGNESVRAESVQALEDHEEILPVIVQFRNKRTTTSDYILNAGAFRRAFSGDLFLFFGYSYATQLLIAVLAKLRGKKSVLFMESVARHRHSRARPWLKWAKRSVIPWLFDTAIVPGPKHRDYAVTSLGFEPDQVYIAPNGIACDEFGPPRSALAEDHALRLLFVGRVAPEKNLELLLNYAHVADARITIVGSGDPVYEAALKDRSPPNVTWRGYVPHCELGDIYRAHDLLVLPSKDESWGFVINEAIAQGMPVLISDEVGAVPVLVDGNGATFPSDSLVSLAEGVAEIRENYAAMSQRSLLLARTFDCEQQAVSIVGVLDSL